MEKSSKRGKIPQSDWPQIVARYEAGETLANIARTYDCSPPAISYVVSRSRTRLAPPGAVAAAPPIAEAQPQLIKAADPAGIRPPPAAAAPPQAAPSVGEAGSRSAPFNGAPPRDEHTVRSEPPQPSAYRDERPGAINGFGANGHGGRDPQPHPQPGRPFSPAPQRQPHPGPQNSVPAPAPTPLGNGDPRRTLHLALGAPNQPGAYRNGSPPSDSPPAVGAPHASPPAAATSPHLPLPLPGPAREPERPGNAGGRKDSGSFIDEQLRARVDDDIGAFLKAFDAALMQDTQESRSSLREATDRLLRVGARTRIELERLEARVPLPPRDGSGRGEPAWRQR